MSVGISMKFVQVDTSAYLAIVTDAVQLGQITATSTPFILIRNKKHAYIINFVIRKCNIMKIIKGIKIFKALNVLLIYIHLFYQCDSVVFSLYQFWYNITNLLKIKEVKLNECAGMCQQDTFSIEIVIQHD